MTVEILVVDDEPEIRHLLKTLFEREGFKVSEAGNADAARKRLAQGSASLVTLDLTLGADDGLSLAREIRGKSDIPIIMVTGKIDPIDRVVGLELGADDYISKPFNLREVLARVRAVLRRHEPARTAVSRAAPGGERLEFGDWRLDIDGRDLRSIGGEERDLTTGEFNLLELFLRRPHRVMSRDDLMDLLKGHDWSPLDRSIDALVARLRKKIEPNIDRPTHIKTVRGIGYMFASNVKAL